MPLVVNILESLDLAYLERDEQTADLEMLKEDNEQLQTQYEREKALRKQTEQKYIEIEDTLIGQNKELDKKIESLESIMRMLELKAKNATDHGKHFSFIFKKSLYIWNFFNKQMYLLFFSKPIGRTRS